jgi:hypothetical protein
MVMTPINNYQMQINSPTLNTNDYYGHDPLDIGHRIKVVNEAGIAG